ISGLENLGRSPRLILSGGLTQVSGGIIRNDGTFSIPGVPSGNYTLQALAEVPSTFVFPANGTAGPATNSFPSSNVLNLEVHDKNIEDVQLNVPPMSHLRGRILFDK